MKIIVINENSENSTPVTDYDLEHADLVLAQVDTCFITMKNRYGQNGKKIDIYDLGCVIRDYIAEENVKI